MDADDPPHGCGCCDLVSNLSLIDRRGLSSPFETPYTKQNPQALPPGAGLGPWSPLAHGGPMTLFLSWLALALWLVRQGRRPADLLQGFDGLSFAGEPQLPEAERVRLLLSRGLQLAVALERWQRLGLWVAHRLHRRSADPAVGQGISVWSVEDAAF